MIAPIYAEVMAQLVVRIPDDLAAAVDRLVEIGVVGSRSEAVRAALGALVDEHRRREVGASIVAGYEARPQGEEVAWSDDATTAMIAEEPW